MLIRRMSSFPPILCGGSTRRPLTQEDRENIKTMLRYSRDYQDPIMMVYVNRQGGLSSKLIVVDTLTETSFSAMVYADLKDNANGTRITDTMAKNFSVSGVLKTVVFRMPTAS